MQFCDPVTHHRAHNSAQPGRKPTTQLGSLLQSLLVSTAIVSMVVSPGWHGALANPAGATVVAGQADISASGSRLSITNSPGTIINWQDFSVAPHELTQFIQQHANSAILNRVIGPNLSELQGALTSNGKVFLINPNGIAVGAGAVIDTNGFVASTLNMSNEDFRAGRLNFAGDTSAGIDNAGIILSHAGDVLLVAPRIHNSGLIQTDAGDILLAAGHSVTIADVSLTGVSFELQAPDNEIVNLGQLLAHGTAAAFAGTLTQAGVVQADSLSVGADGEIILSAGGDVTLTADSTSSAAAGSIHIESGTAGDLATTWIEGDVLAEGDTGGRIRLLGPQVGVAGAARISADGSFGGGTINIGGSQQGQGPLPNSTNTYIGAEAVVSASATSNGDGGEIIMFAENFANVDGALVARGGPHGGNGGFIETSGLQSLDVATVPNAGADAGAGGEWLIDPINLLISSATTALVTGDGGALPFVPTAVGANLLDADIRTALDSGSVTIRTRGTPGQQAGNVVFDGTAVIDIDGIGVAGPDLRVEAAGNVVLNGTIIDSTPGGDDVFILFDADGDILINNTITGTVVDLFAGDARAVRLNGDILTGSGESRIFNANITLDSDVTINLDFLSGAQSAGRFNGSNSPVNLNGFALTFVGDGGVQNTIDLNSVSDTGGSGALLVNGANRLTVAGSTVANILDVSSAGLIDLLGAATVDTVALRNTFSGLARFRGPINFAALNSEPGGYSLQLLGGGSITAPVALRNFGSGNQLNDEVRELLTFAGGFSDVASVTFLGGEVDTQGSDFTVAVLRPLGVGDTITTGAGNLVVGATASVDGINGITLNVGGTTGLGGTFTTNGTPMRFDSAGTIFMQSSFFLDTTGGGATPGGANISLASVDGDPVGTFNASFNAGSAGAVTAGNIDLVENLTLNAAQANIGRVTDGGTVGTVTVTGGEVSDITIGPGSNFDTLNVNVQNGFTLSTSSNLAINSFFVGGDSDISNGSVLTLPASIDTNGVGTQLWRFAGGTTTVNEIVDSVGNDENLELLFEANAGPVTFTGDIEAAAVFAHADGAEQTSGNISAQRLGYSQSCVGGLVTFAGDGNQFNQVGISNGGSEVAINSTTAVQLDTVTVGARSGSGLSASTLSLTAAAASQTPTGLITVDGGGDVFFNGGATGNFILDQANVLSDVGVNLAGGLVLNNSGGLNLLGLTAASADITASDLMQAFPITAGDLVIDVAGGAVTLLDAANDVDTLSVLNALSFNYADANDLTLTQLISQGTSVTAGGNLIVQGFDFDGVSLNTADFISTGGNVTVTGAIFDSVPGGEFLELTLDAFGTVQVLAPITDVGALGIRAGDASQGGGGNIVATNFVLESNGNGGGLFTFNDAANNFGTFASAVGSLNLADVNDLGIDAVAFGTFAQTSLQNTGSTSVTVGGLLDLPNGMDFNTGTAAARNYSLTAGSFSIGGNIADGDPTTGSEDALNLELHAPGQDLALAGRNIQVNSLKLTLGGFSLDPDAGINVADLLDLQGGTLNSFDFSQGNSVAARLTTSVAGDVIYVGQFGIELGNINASTLDLSLDDGVTQSPGSTINTSVLRIDLSNAGDVLLGEDNDTDDLDVNLTNGNLGFRDINTLNLVAVNANLAAFNSDGLTESFNANLNVNVLAVIGGATNDVVLTEPTNNFGSLDANVARNLFVSSPSLTLRNIVANDVAVNTIFGVSQLGTATIVANDLAVFVATSGSISLPEANDVASFTAAIDGNITFNDINAVNLGDITASNAVDLTATTMTQQAATAIVASNLTLNDGSVGGLLVDQANNVSTLTVNAAGADVAFTDVDGLSLDNVVARNFTLSAGSVDQLSTTSIVLGGGTGVLNLVGGALGTFDLFEANDVGTITANVDTFVDFNDINTLTVGDLRSIGSTLISAGDDITINGLDYDSGTALFRSVDMFSGGAITISGAGIFDSDIGTGSEDSVSFSFNSVSGTTIDAPVTATRIFLASGGADDTPSGALTTGLLVLDGAADDYLLDLGSHDADLFAGTTNGTVRFNDSNSLTIQTFMSETDVPGARIGDGTINAVGNITLMTLNVNQQLSQVPENYLVRLNSLTGNVNVLGNIIDSNNNTLDTLDLVLGAPAGNVSIQGTVFGADGGGPLDNLLITANSADDGASGTLAMVPNFAFSGGSLTFDNSTHQVTNIALAANTVGYRDQGSPNFTDLLIDGINTNGFAVQDSADIIASSLTFPGTNYDGVGSATYRFLTTSGDILILGNIFDGAGADDLLTLSLNAAGNVQFDSLLQVDQALFSGLTVDDGSTGSILANQLAIQADDVVFDNSSHDVGALAINASGSAVFQDMNDLTVRALTIDGISTPALRTGAAISAGGDLNVEAVDYDLAGTDLFQFTSTGGNVNFNGLFADSNLGTADAVTLTANAGGNVNVTAGGITVENLRFTAGADITDAPAAGLAATNVGLVAGGNAILDDGANAARFLGAETNNLVFNGTGIIETLGVTIDRLPIAFAPTGNVDVSTDQQITLLADFDGIGARQWRFTSTADRILVAGVTDSVPATPDFLDLALRAATDVAVAGPLQANTLLIDAATANDNAGMGQLLVNAAALTGAGLFDFGTGNHDVSQLAIQTGGVDFNATSALNIRPLTIDGTSVEGLRVSGRADVFVRNGGNLDLDGFDYDGIGTQTYRLSSTGGIDILSGPILDSNPGTPDLLTLVLEDIAFPTVNIDTLVSVDRLLILAQSANDGTTGQILANELALSGFGAAFVFDNPATHNVGALSVSADSVVYEDAAGVSIFGRTIDGVFVPAFNVVSSADITTGPGAGLQLPSIDVEGLGSPTYRFTTPSFITISQPVVDSIGDSPDGLTLVLNAGGNINLATVNMGQGISGFRLFASTANLFSDALGGTLQATDFAFLGNAMDLSSSAHSVSNIALQANSVLYTDAGTINFADLTIDGNAVDAFNITGAQARIVTAGAIAVPMIDFANAAPAEFLFSGSSILVANPVVDSNPLAGSNLELLLDAGGGFVNINALIDLGAGGGLYLNGSGAFQTQPLRAQRLGIRNNSGMAVSLTNAGNDVDILGAEMIGALGLNFFDNDDLTIADVTIGSQFVRALVVSSDATIGTGGDLSINGIDYDGVNGASTYRFNVGGGQLQVNGPIADSNPGVEMLTLNFNAAPGVGVMLDSLVNVDRMVITSNTSIDDGASGQVIANGLALTGGGNFLFDNPATHNVGTLSVRSNDITFGNLGPLNLAGQTIAGVTVPALQATGNVDLRSAADVNVFDIDYDGLGTVSYTFTSTGGNVNFPATNIFDGGTGAPDFLDLNVSAAGSVNFNGANIDVRNLFVSAGALNDVGSQFISVLNLDLAGGGGGDFVFDETSLNIAGDLSASLVGSNLVIDAFTTLNLGALSADNITINSVFGLTQTSGTGITTATLTINPADGNVVLDQLNDVDNLAISGGGSLTNVFFNDVNEVVIDSLAPTGDASISALDIDGGGIFVNRLTLSGGTLASPAAFFGSNDVGILAANLAGALTLFDDTGVILDNVTLGGQLSLTASSASQLPGTALNAVVAVFNGGGGGNFVLDQNNDVDLLGGNAAGSGLVFVDVNDLQVTNSTFNSLDLTATSISQGATTLIAPSLTLTGGSTGPVVLDSATNNFDTLLANVAGNLTIGNVDGLVLAGVTAGGTASFTTGANLTQSGAVNAGALNAVTSGDVLLPLANMIGAVSGAATGTFQIFNGQPGLVVDNLSAATFNLDTPSASQVAGNLVAPVAIITGGSAGDLNFTGPGNDLGSLNAAVGNGLAIRDGNALTLQNVSVGTTLTVVADSLLQNTGTTLTAAALNLTGTGTGSFQLTETVDTNTLTANVFDLFINDSDDLTLGNVVVANNLGIDAGSLAQLPATNITVGANSAFSGGTLGAFLLSGANNFGGIGATLASDLLVNDSNSLTIDNITAANVTLTAGQLLQFGGTAIITNVLDINGGALGDLNLPEANDVTTLRGSSASGIVFTDANTLSLGSLTAATFLTLNAGSASQIGGTGLGAANATFNGGADGDFVLLQANNFNSVAANVANSLLLNDVDNLQLQNVTVGNIFAVGAGSLSQLAGSAISAPTLQLRNGGTGAFVLDRNNDVDSLDVAISSNLVFTDMDDLVLDPLGGISLANNVTLAATSVASSAPIAVGTLDLSGVSVATNLSGLLTAASVTTGPNSASVVLNGGTNIAGAATFNNTGGVLLDGSMAASVAAGSITSTTSLTALNGFIDVQGNLTVADVDLLGNTAITSSTGDFTAATINANGFDLNVALFGSTASLNSIVSGGLVTLLADDVTVTGGLQATSLDLSAVSLSTTVGGPVTLTSLVSGSGASSISLLGNTSVSNATLFANTGGVQLGATQANVLAFAGGVNTSASNLALAGSLQSTASAITLGAVTLLDQATISAGNAAITIGDVLAGNNSLLLSAPGNVITINSLAAVNTLTPTAATLTINGTYAANNLDLTLVGLSTLNGTGTSTAVTQVGDINGAGTLTSTGSYNWAGGVQSQGSTVINGTLQLTAANGQGLDAGRNLQINGTATISASLGLALNNGASISNAANGVINLQGDVDLLSTAGTGSINNAGTIVRSVSSGTAGISVALTNTGTVQVDTGLLRVAGGGTSSGVFRANSGATLAFDQTGTPGHTLANGARLQGAGLLTVANRGLDITATTTPVLLDAASSLNLIGANLQGGGTLNANGAVLVTGNGSSNGTINVVAGTGQLVLGPNSTFSVPTLNNNNRVEFAAGMSGDNTFLTVGTFTNNATLALAGSGSITGAYVESAAATLNQTAGTFAFNAQGGTLVQNGSWTSTGSVLNLQNSTGPVINGSLNLTGTTLSSDANLTWNSPAIMLNGATLSLVGSNLLVNGGGNQQLSGGTVNAANVNIGNSVVFAGSTVNATGFNVLAGQTTVRDTTLAATSSVDGQLLATGSSSLGNIGVSAGGTFMVNADTAAANVAALSINNAGMLVLDSSSAGGLGAQLSVSGLTNTASGILEARATGSAGTRSITASSGNAFSNAGIIRTSAVRLDLVDAFAGSIFTNTGNLMSDGQDLNITVFNLVNSGTLDIRGAAVLALTGNLDLAGGSVLGSGSSQVSGSTTVSAASNINTGTFASAALNVLGNLNVAAGTLVNAGSVDNAGALTLAGTLNVAGSLQQTGGSLTLANAATVMAGTDIRISGGTLTTGDHTLTTPNLMLGGMAAMNGNTTVSGAVNVGAAGNLTLTSADATTSTRFGSLVNAGQITLAGGAADTLLTSSTLMNTGTIRSAGGAGLRRIEVTSASGLTNAGTIQAQGSRLLTIDNNAGGSITNTGLLSADGVRYDVTASNVINTGILESLNGGLLEINGNLRQNGSTRGNSQIGIIGMTTLGGMGVSIINTPDFTVTDLEIAPGGEVRVQSRLVVQTSIATGAGGMLMVDPGGSVSIAGAFNNTGTTQLATGTMFNAASVTSTGTLGVAGTLNVAGDFNVDAGAVTLNTATVMVGGMTQVGAGNFSASNSMLQTSLLNVTGTAAFSGTSAVAGDINVAAGANLQVANSLAATRLTNAGTVTATTPTAVLNVANITSTGGTFNVAPDRTLATSGNLSLVDSSLASNASATSRLQVGGTLRAAGGSNVLGTAAVSAANLVVDSGASLTSTGSINATGGAMINGTADLTTLDSSGGAVAVNAGLLTLTGLSTGTAGSRGALTVTGGSFANSGVSNVGAITLATATAAFGGATTGTSFTATGSTLTSNAALNLTSLGLGADSTGTFNGPVSASGGITVTGSQATFLGAVAAAPLTVGNMATVGLRASNVTGNINVNAGGTLNGTASVTGNVGNAGTFSVGNSFGLFNISGNYVQAPAGVLVIEIGGTPPYVAGDDFDRLSISGSATLAGTLRVVELDNSNPIALASATLSPITFASAQGTFATVESIGGPSFRFAGTVGPNGLSVRNNATTNQIADEVLRENQKDPSQNSVDSSQNLAELSDEQQDLEGCDNDDSDTPETRAPDEHGVGCR